jgi:hypothetical protein
LLCALEEEEEKKRRKGRAVEEGERIKVHCTAALINVFI